MESDRKVIIILSVKAIAIWLERQLFKFGGHRFKSCSRFQVCSVVPVRVATNFMESDFHSGPRDSDSELVGETKKRVGFGRSLPDSASDLWACATMRKHLADRGVD